MRNLRSFFHIWIEILVRIALIVAFIKLETMEPFKRQILPDEIWIYR
jgi:diacylglycerol diphosphate phosphatase / phosphatidate phosphatase